MVVGEHKQYVVTGGNTGSQVCVTGGNTDRQVCV